MPDLETVQTADLMLELRKRFAHCVFIGREERTTASGLQVSFRHGFTGDLDTCTGLAFRVAHMIAGQMLAGARQVPMDPTGGNTEEDSYGDGGSGNDPA